jgi:chloramphenicol 3-O phosphotransferase
MSSGDPSRSVAGVRGRQLHRCDASRDADIGRWLEFGPDGEVIVGPLFRQLEAAWMEGIIAMSRAGANIILDEVFLGGETSQRRWADAIGDLEVLWVGVRCAATVAAGREIARGDRISGMAASQADVVHQGVKYDLEVDTTHAESIDCARIIALHLK